MQASPTKTSASRLARTGRLTLAVGLLTLMTACVTFPFQQQSSAPNPKSPRVVERDLSGMTTETSPRTAP